MSDAITHKTITAVREDAIRLVNDCQWVVATAHDIVKKLAGGIDFKALSPRRQGLWKHQLVMFAESIVELSEHLDTSAVPPEALLERLEAGQPVAEALSVAGASRVQLAHDLTNLVLNAITAPLDAVSSLANKSARHLSDSDISKVLKWAKQVATLEEFSKREANRLVAGVRSETAEAMKGVVPEDVGPQPTTANKLPVPTEAKAGSKPVQLFGRHEPALVLNVPLVIKTDAQYDVIRALVAVFPGGLPKILLEKNSKHDDAVNVLKKLRKKHELWAKTIRLPGGNHQGGYRLVYPSKNSTPHHT